MPPLIWPGGFWRTWKKLTQNREHKNRWRAHKDNFRRNINFFLGHIKSPFPYSYIDFKVTTTMRSCVPNVFFLNVLFFLNKYNPFPLQEFFGAIYVNGLRRAHVHTKRVRSAFAGSATFENFGCYAPSKEQTFLFIIICSRSSRAMTFKMSTEFRAPAQLVLQIFRFTRAATEAHTNSALSRQTNLQ